jgi:hypothetical protein
LGGAQSQQLIPGAVRFHISFFILQNIGQIMLERGVMAGESGFFGGAVGSGNTP